MSDEEKVWRGKTDEEVLAAARRLADYTEEGERAIRAEIQRRGLDESPPTIRHSDPPVGSQTSSSHRYTDRRGRGRRDCLGRHRIV
jgi:hypothetical protein